MCNPAYNLFLDLAGIADLAKRGVLAEPFVRSVRRQQGKKRLCQDISKTFTANSGKTDWLSTGESWSDQVPRGFDALFIRGRCELHDLGPMGSEVFGPLTMEEV